MLILAIPVLACMAGGGWAAWLQQGGNLHAVLPGEVYRSAQPSEAQLTAWTATHGFRSVLNLRGASEADWYRIERATADRLNLQYADFVIRKAEIAAPDQAVDLIALLESLMLRGP